MSAAHISPAWDWTDERVTTLSGLWTDGWSAGQIAKHLGGVTRSAVIGKVHRLGLSDKGRAHPTAPGARINARPHAKPKPPPAQRQTQDFRPSPKFAPAPVLRIIVTKGEYARPFKSLGARNCRWPLSLDVREEATADTPFCAAPTADGEVYCSDCRPLAWRPPAKVGAAYARSLRKFA